MNSSGYLYDVLDVPKDSTPTAIKRAYYRKALQLHPDKTGGTTTEAFKDIEEAHRILMDPGERRLYDLVGRAGLRRMSAMGMMGEWCSISRIRTALALAGCVFGLFFLLLILVTIKLDYGLGLSWGVVGLPLWVLYPCIATLALTTMVHGLRHHELYGVWIGSELLVLLLAAAVSAAALAHRVSPTQALLPWTLWYVLGSIRHVGQVLGRLHSPLAEAADEGTAPHRTREVCRQFVVDLLPEKLGIGLFLILCFYRASPSAGKGGAPASAPLSFWIVSAPLMAYGVWATACQAWEGWQASHSPASSSWGRERETSLAERLFSAVVAALPMSAVVYLCYMWTAKAEWEVNHITTGGLHPSALVALAPLFLVSLGLLLCPCLACCLLSLVIGLQKESAAAEEASMDPECPLAAGVDRDTAHGGAFYSSVCTTHRQPEEAERTKSTGEAGWSDGRSERCSEVGGGVFIGAL